MKMLALEVTLAALPLCAFSQSYANSAFSITNEIPATAHVEGWSHGSIRANGLTIDLSESRSALEMKEIRGSGTSSRTWIGQGLRCSAFISSTTAWA